MGCHSLLQGIFPTQELNPGLMSSALAAGFFTTSATWEALNIISLLTIIEFKNFPQNKLAEAWLKISSDVLKVKVKMKVAQSCPTLCEPVNCSPPGSSAHGDSPGKNAGVGSYSLLQGIFPTQGLNRDLPPLQADSLASEPPGKPTFIMETVNIKLSNQIYRVRRMK